MMLRLPLLLGGAAFALAVGLSWQSGDRDEFATRHPVRRRLLALILRRPGVRLAALWKALDANRKTTKYHLMILEQANIVTSFHGRRATHYFAADVEPEARRLVSLLLRGRVLEVVREVRRRPGISQRELGAALSMRRKALRTYADLLTETLLLEEVRGPHSRRYYPTPRLGEVLPLLSQGTADRAKAQDPPSPTWGADPP